MNYVVEEIQSMLDGTGDELAHYGMPRRSGRYPWGSGENPYQHSGDFLSRYEELKKNGHSEKDIAKLMGIVDEHGNPSTSRLRAQKTKATDERKLYLANTAKSLKEDGLGYTEIGRKMGVSESTVRSWLSPNFAARRQKAMNTANFIKQKIDEKGMIDVTAGVERELGVSKEKLKEALLILESEGYPIYKGRFAQATNPGKFTTQRVICPPGTEHKDIYDLGKVHALNEDNYVSHDNGETFDRFVYPKSLDSKRLKILLADEIGPDGERGVDKDGIVQIRRGVPDLSLGNDHYSQVRILVDGKKYIKGMAVYSDDLPDGVDVLFNSNKTSYEKALKDIKNDPENPFGSLIRAGGQSYYFDENGERQLSLINKRASEGDWSEWKDKLPAQFLSKQSLDLAERQLGQAITDKKSEYDELCSLTNPTVKKHLLKSFADDCDSAAVHLQAAALPGQKYHVIIPVNTLKETEVYAPQYDNGTKLALIRYPHGGTFEIPILTVNNRHESAKKLIGNDSRDAVGINKAVADRLSGADFDGDTVMCIPTHDRNGSVKITSTPPLKGLEGFDPHMEYAERPGMTYMTKRNTQLQMGVISNLITDMTLQGASQDELARAVRHSMVVIDAEKHKLDYKKSEIDNNIAALKKEYQTGGASTLISRAKSQYRVDKRQGTPKTNLKGKPWYDPSKPEGSLVYTTADDIEYTVPKTNKKTGEVIYETRRRQQISTRMAETDDARTLISEADTPMERAYAHYANTMKAMANQARLEIASTGKIPYSADAKHKYQHEVDTLNAKLNESLKNAPRERQAQRLANSEVRAKQQANPDMSKSDIKKESQRALSKYRIAVGAKRQPIIITDKEWEAIQAGAITETTLTKILTNTDTDNLRQRATPRTTTTLSDAKVTRIKNMSSSYTIAEIAKALGLSPSTVSNYLKGEN